MYTENKNEQCNCESLKAKNEVLRVKLIETLSELSKAKDLLSEAECLLDNVIVMIQIHILI